MPNLQKTYGLKQPGKAAAQAAHVAMIAAKKGPQAAPPGKAPNPPPKLTTSHLTNPKPTATVPPQPTPPAPPAAPPTPSFVPPAATIAQVAAAQAAQNKAIADELKGKPPETLSGS